MLREIAVYLPGKNAAKLATVSKNAHSVISKTHPTLPKGPSKYVAGTGRYQKLYKKLPKMLKAQESATVHWKVYKRCFDAAFAFKQAKKALKRHTLVHLVAATWRKESVPNLSPLMHLVKQRVKKLGYKDVLSELKKKTQGKRYDESLGDKLMDGVILAVMDYGKISQENK